MLEVTSTAQEVALGVDFAEIYRKSDLYRYANGMHYIYTKLQRPFI